MYDFREVGDTLLELKYTTGARIHSVMGKMAHLPYTVFGIRANFARMCPNIRVYRM